MWIYLCILYTVPSCLTWPRHIHIYFAYCQKYGQISILGWLFLDKNVNKQPFVLTKQLPDTALMMFSLRRTPLKHTLLPCPYWIKMLRGISKPSSTKHTGNYNLIWFCCDSTFNQNENVDLTPRRISMPSMDCYT